MSTMTYKDTLSILECGNCHITFAIPEDFHRKLRRTGELFWCPNGHHIGYSEDENTKLKAQLDQAKADARYQREARDRARAEADHQAAVARGYKGALVQAKQRSAKGLCPVPGCKRHFVNVQRHVENQHPDFTPAPQL